MKAILKILPTMLIASSMLLSHCDNDSILSADTSEDIDVSMMKDVIEEIALTELSDEEAKGLILMREEEKLARDVYLKFYDIWGLKIFNNISQSESVHMANIALLLERYELEDPVVSDNVGDFSDELFTILYNDLTEIGSKSLLDALIVGATIEDLDIKDLMDLRDKTDNEDILIVYDNLTMGSRNHIRNYYGQILRNNGNYEAQFISQTLLDSIIATPMEKGTF